MAPSDNNNDPNISFWLTHIKAFSDYVMGVLFFALAIYLGFLTIRDYETIKIPEDLPWLVLLIALLGAGIFFFLRGLKKAFPR